MQSNRIVFIPTIAVIAGLSAFLSVLLICLDLVPAFGAGEVMQAKTKRAFGKVETREYGGKAESGEPEQSLPREKAEVESHTRIESASELPLGPEAREGQKGSHRDGGSAEAAEQREHLERDHRPNPQELTQHLLEASKHLAVAGFREEAEELRERAAHIGAHERPTDRRIENLESRLRELEGNVSRMREEMERVHMELQERRGAN